MHNALSDKKFGGFQTKRRRLLTETENCSSDITNDKFPIIPRNDYLVYVIFLVLNIDHLNLL